MKTINGSSNSLNVVQIMESNFASNGINKNLISNESNNMNQHITTNFNKNLNSKKDNSNLFSSEKENILNLKDLKFEMKNLFSNVFQSDENTFKIKIEEAKKSEREIQHLSSSRKLKKGNSKVLSNEIKTEKIDLPVELKIISQNQVNDNLGINGRGFVYRSFTIAENDYKGDILNRRYNRNNIEKGKSFFKMRYIREKFDELINRNNKNLIEDKGIFEIKNRDSVRSISINNNINQTYIPSNVVLNGDKNAIKFNSLFLQKLEKGIFSFNLKKYEDSYNYLYGNGIVKDESEFGELLLVIKCFDKYIVGDFLAKEKYPNKNKKVLEGFMQSMDFCNMKFLDSFRFMLSRLNLPKDATLILEIIDMFSKVYYADNILSSLFKDTNSIYLLASSVLALNTMFSRSDIKNMRILEKEDFVKMNKDVDSTVVENIYDDLKFNKLDIITDYNEVIYKRISVEGRPEVDFFTPNQVLSKSHQKEGNIQQSEIRGEEIITMLKKGETFIKYGNRGDPHPRVVKLSEDESKIMWYSIGGCNFFNKTKYIKLRDVHDVCIGAGASKIFGKHQIPPELDSNCFSIMSSKRSLDLRKDDENICKKWFHAIKYILKRTKSMAEFKNNKNNLKDIINKNEIISDIWKTEILPNWHIYRKFVLVKGKENLIESFNGVTNKKDLTKRNKEKFARIISKNSSYKLNEKIIDDKDKSEFLYLWTLGIPDWLRKKIWLLVIGNVSEVTENLFNYHMKMVETINFELLMKILQESNDEDNVNGNSNQIFHNKSQMRSKILKIKSKFHVCEDPILNEIINDVVKISMKFSEEVKDQNLELNNFMQDLFKVVRIFTIFRPDITYSTQICYISAVILLNSENYYAAFVSLVNFVIPSFIMKFLTRDEIYIKIRHQFFEKLMSNYVPSVFQHFSKMDISTSLFFFNWIENVFIGIFKYEILLRIWDIYLLKGEVFLYEVGLCLLKIQEKELLRIPVKEILRNLKKLPMKINVDEFFDTLQEIDISEDYKKLIYENSLASEKGVLFQSFLIEWI